jgi:hypothetical protein
MISAVFFMKVARFVISADQSQAMERAVGHQLEALVPNTKFSALSSLVYILGGNTSLITFESLSRV